MSFDVTAEAYGRFMGRFSGPLAAEFVEFSGVRTGDRAVDVGCGPGALTARLVDLLGAGNVAAVDPSEPFLAATAARFPLADVRPAAAEQLPFPDDGFDHALAQLVVHFMSDAVAGLREMGRVTRPGGVVSACVWDHAGVGGPLTTFWQAVRDLDPGAPGEGQLAGTREGHLGELCAEAGLRDIESDALVVRVPFGGFDDWWEPYTLGVGPAGAHVAQLDGEAREQLRTHCAELLPSRPFEIVASAWCVRSRA